MKNVFFITLFTLTLLISCQSAQEREAKQIVNEWIGKKILLDSQTFSSTNGNDTLCPEIMEKPYKILLYVDTTGCTSCNLKLIEWKNLIDEIDSIAPGKVGFVFLLNSKNKKEIISLFNSFNINYPIIIDSTDAINKANHFPSKPSYRCFLLDRNFKVLAIGNPALNYAIRKLYVQKITNDPAPAPPVMTKIVFDSTIIDVGSIQLGSEKKGTFHIKNTGNNILIIHDINTSCGCTKADFEKAPIKPNNQSKIKITIKPDEVGIFQKSITVYCNTADSPYKLTIKGLAKE
jgi:hypothetical protein